MKNFPWNSLEYRSGTSMCRIDWSYLCQNLYNRGRCWSVSICAISPDCTHFTAVGTVSFCSTVKSLSF